MRYWHISRLVLLSFLFGLQLVQASPTQAVIPLAISDTTLIYYRLDPNGGDTCTDHTPISLSDFIKKTLPNEWIEGWGNTSGGIEALKAGAIAIRTFTISFYHAEVITVNGQNYYCAKAWRQKFDPAEVISNSPNSVAAVNATSGIIMTHPNASSLMGTKAIDAQYRDDTGQWTNTGAYPWLKSIYDPISTGSPQTGLGQHGSKRWAWGYNDSGQAFPKWDYRRILAHYYSEIVFDGITNPDPPEVYRSNMLQIQAGIPPQGNFTMRKGEERTGIRVLYQNVGTSAWPVNGTDAQGLCPTGTTYYTLLSYHLYRLDGSGPVCGSSCVGIRRTPMCQSDYVISKGEHHWINGFRVYIPDHPAIISGQTYLLRFDVEHRNDSVWGGYPSFAWPSQDIPVTIDTPPGGGGDDDPVVVVDYPPAVVTYGDLVNGRYGFSWSSPNASTYDVEYRSKEIYQASYPTGFNTLLSNSPAQQFSATVGCNEDRLDWQFRLRGRNSNGTGDWGYVGSQTQVYPHPWLSYWSIGALVLDTDPGSWNRPSNVLNLGGGTFNWTATDDQSWITTNSSGQGEGPLGTILYKPGGIGDYFGTITINFSNFQPNVNCSGASSFQIPVGIYIRAELETYYLPIIFKNSQ